MRTLKHYHNTQVVPVLTQHPESPCIAWLNYETFTAAMGNRNTQSCKLAGLNDLPWYLCSPEHVHWFNPYGETIESIRAREKYHKSEARRLVILRDEARAAARTIRKEKTKQQVEANRAAKLAASNIAKGVMLSYGAVYTVKDTEHKSFRTWFGMIYRCHNDKNYLHRKPPVEWYTFANFAADMGERPDGLTIDRTNNDKPYGPNNCRWATMKQQVNNRGKTIRVMYKGELVTLSELAEYLHVARNCLLWRVENNWPEDTWGSPAKDLAPNLFVFLGKSSTVAEIATTLNIPLTALQARIKAYRKRGLPLKSGDLWPEVLSAAAKPAPKKREPKTAQQETAPKGDFWARFYAKHSHLTPPPPLIDRSAIQSPT